MNPPKRLLVHFCLVSLCFLCYIYSFRCEFLFDDASAIVANKDLRPTTSVFDLFVHDFWGTPLDKDQSHKSYRPLTVLTFRLNYVVDGLDPFGYHLVNVLLHCAVTCVFFETLNLLKNFITFESMFFAACLFAVHPVHVEAVVGVVGRAELLSALFYLFALLCFVQKCWPFASVVLIGLGTFCKEQSITGIGVCFFWLIFTEHVGNWMQVHRTMLKVRRTLIWLVIGAVSVLALRFVALRGSLPHFTSYDNPAASSSNFVRQLTYIYLVAQNFWLLIFPNSLCADWTMGTIPLVTAADIRLIYAAVFYCWLLAISYFAIKPSRMIQRLETKAGLILLVLPFVPASNLFFPVGFVVAERVLYLPSMGYCLLVCIGYETLGKKWKNQTGLLRIGAVLCCVMLASKSLVRTFDWRNDYTLFLSGLKVTQNNAKIFNNVGHALESQGLFVEALPYYRKASEVQPDDLGSFMNVGRALAQLKRLNEAESYFLKAKHLLPKSGSIARVAPSHLNIFINLGQVYKNLSRLYDAERMYRQAIFMRSDFISAYLNLGDLLLSQNRTDEALEVFTGGLQFDHQNVDLLYDCGIVHLKRGNTHEAFEYFEKALTVDPNHLLSLINVAFTLDEMAKIAVDNLQKVKLRQLAIERLSLALSSKSDDSHLLMQLGNMQFESSSYLEALKSFKRVIQLTPTSRVGWQNLALVEVKLALYDDALKSLQQLLVSHPKNVRALLTMCDIYGNHIKNIQAAERCYKDVLDVDARNVQARHNLCIILMNSSSFVKEVVLECLTEARRLIDKRGPYTLELYNVLEQKFNAAVRQF